LPIVSSYFGRTAHFCVTLQFLHTNQALRLLVQHLRQKWQTIPYKCRKYLQSAINTHRNTTPKMVHFPMTRIPDTLESAQNNGHQAFQAVYSYRHITSRYFHDYFSGWYISKVQGHYYPHTWMGTFTGNVHIQSYPGSVFKSITYYRNPILMFREKQINLIILSILMARSYPHSDPFPWSGMDDNYKHHNCNHDLYPLIWSNMGVI
jgi:hypothetical protein